MGDGWCSGLDKVEIILYLYSGNMRHWVFQTMRRIALKWFYFCSVSREELQIGMLKKGTETYKHTHISQQVHRLIRVFPAVWRRSVGCRYHLSQLHRDPKPSATHAQTHTSAARWANTSWKRCALSYPKGRLLARWWMCCSAACPPFVNRVIEPQWHPAPPCLLHPGSGQKQTREAAKSLASEWGQKYFVILHSLWSLNCFSPSASLARIKKEN